LAEKRNGIEVSLSCPLTVWGKSNGEEEVGSLSHKPLPLCERLQEAPAESVLRASAVSTALVCRSCAQFSALLPSDWQQPRQELPLIEASPQKCASYVSLAEEDHRGLG